MYESIRASWNESGSSDGDGDDDGGAVVPYIRSLLESIGAAEAVLHKKPMINSVPMSYDMSKILFRIVIDVLYAVSIFITWFVGRNPAMLQYSTRPRVFGRECRAEAKANQANELNNGNGGNICVAMLDSVRISFFQLDSCPSLMHAVRLRVVGARYLK